MESDLSYVSPYKDPGVELCLGDGASFAVPYSILSKYPKLSPHNSFGIYRPKGLQKVSPGVGHVIVHYLFANTYQCLKPKGQTAHEKLSDEFRTSIQVYAAARIYELKSLGELAKAEIERLGEGLPLQIILDLVHTAYPDPGVDDLWFIGYLKSQLEAFLGGSEDISQGGFPQPDRETISVGEVLLKSLIELLLERDCLPLKAPGTATASTDIHGPEPQARQAPTNQPVSDINGPISPATDINNSGPNDVDQGQGLRLEPMTLVEDGRKAVSAHNGPVQEPEPDPVLESIDDEVWGFSNKSKKKKKKSIHFDDVVEPVGEPEPVLEPVPEPYPEPYMEPPIEEELAAIPDAEPISDAPPEPFTELLVEEKPAAPEYEWIPKPPPESPVEQATTTDNGWGFVVTSNVSKKNKKKKKKLSSWDIQENLFGVPAAVSVPPREEENGTLNGSSVCTEQANHLLEGTWKECPDCRMLARRLRDELVREESSSI